MPVRRIHWIALTALCAALLVGWGLAGFSGSTAQAARADPWQAALDDADAVCRDRYRGLELDACLAGALQAHRQALTGLPHGTRLEAQGAPRGDI